MFLNLLPQIILNNDLLQAIAPAFRNPNDVAVEERLKLCDESFLRVLNCAVAVNSVAPFDEAIIELFDELDYIARDHIQALQHRLKLLRSFRNLWVTTARTSAMGDLQESGNREIYLRKSFFDKFDAAVMHLELTAIPGLLLEFEKLKVLWSRFQVPNGVELALAARCNNLVAEGMHFNI